MRNWHAARTDIPLERIGGFDAVIESTQESVRRKGFVTSEYRLLDRAGEVRWFRDEAILVRDPSGTPIAWHGVLVEITGMRKLQH